VAGNFGKLGLGVFLIRFPSSGKSYRLGNADDNAAKNFAGVHYADGFHRRRLFYVRRKFEMEQHRFYLLLVSAVVFAFWGKD
jgi:hypothetical protein